MSQLDRIRADWSRAKRDFRRVVVLDVDEKTELIRYAYKRGDSEFLFDFITALCFFLTGKIYKSLEYRYAASELNMDSHLTELFRKACDGEVNEVRKFI